MSVVETRMVASLASFDRVLDRGLSSIMAAVGVKGTIQLCLELVRVRGLDEEGPARVEP